MQALQVLEVREQVERAVPPGTPTISSSVSSVSNGVEGPVLDMDDGEKALVREMCNVSFLFFIPLMLSSKSSLLFLFLILNQSETHKMVVYR